MRRFTDLPHALRPKRFAFIGACVAHLRALSSGDKVIAGALAVLVGLLVLFGAYALESTFLVEIPAHGGSMREGVVGAPRFVNPVLAVTDADRDLALLTYAGLMGYGKDGSLVPVLAERYDVSEDGKTYTFYLRDNAVFSDGTPVTADDVVFTVGKAQDPALKSPIRANWTNIKAEALDARTVQFTLPKAYALFLTETTLGILPAHVWRSVTNEAFPFSPLEAAPIGAGPFIVDQVTRAKDGSVAEYRLRANPRYALGRPYLNTLSFAYYKTQEELTTAVKRGEVESAYGVRTAGALRVPYARIIAVFFNQSQDATLARIEVRKALSIAIDRAALVRDTLGGYGIPTNSPLPAELPDVSTSTDPIADARAVLSRNGWTYDEEAGTWKNADAKLSLSLTLAATNVPELKLVAESLANSWKALGVPVSVELHDSADIAASVIRPRTYDTLLSGMVVGTNRDLYAFWDSAERADPGLNIAQYTNRSVDSLLEKARTEPDATARAADIEKAAALISADYPAAFLYTPEFVYTLPEDIHGLMLPEVSAPSDRLRSAAFWYRKTERVWPFFSSD